MPSKRDAEPVSFVLELDRASIDRYLGERGWLEPGEGVSAVESAGEGNMNCTLRVRTGARSLILKQSRPFVVKYPDIPAPVERLLVEARFYELTGKAPRLRRFTPTLLALDEANYLALIEDLGASADLTALYARDQRLGEADLVALCDCARSLHALEIDAAARDALRNREMRALNHEHIFRLPLQPDNGLDLDAHTPGLAEAARELQGEAAFVARVHELGARYLADGEPAALLHGDYYPGSFLVTPDGIKLIDPEFAFPGPPEFDLGVLGAHLVFAGEDPGVLDRIEAHYDRNLDRPLLEGFAGAELMRRLLGVAQLPLPADTTLEEKRGWLAQARRWVGSR